MVVKKSQTPPAPNAGAEGSTANAATIAGATSSDGATGSTDDASKAQTQEQQIRQNADRQLAKATGDQAIKLAKAEAKANALDGELKRERSAREAAEAKVLQLEAALAAATTAAKNAGTALQGLPSNARQLNECVTIASAAPGVGKGGRLHAKAGDVVIFTKDDAEVAALQSELGLQATVYRVSEKTLEDLEQLGHLHS